VISNTEIERRRKRAELDALLGDDSKPPGFNSSRVEDLREGLRVLDASEESLSTLCSLTGGRLYRPGDFDALGGLYREIADELRHQYALYYKPLNQSRDGRLRRVRVEVKRPGVVVAARTGYYAPR
jgi:VWFA-related protein